MKKEIDIVLVNANKTQSGYIESLLEPNKYSVKKFYEENPAFDYLISNEDFTKVIIVSYQLLQGNGINLIKNLKKQGKEYPFIFLSSDNTIERVVEAMQTGAMDFLSKTYGLAENLEPVIERAYTTQIKILERKDIEDKLLLKNKELAKLSVVASETSNVVCIFDSKLELEWVNKAFVELYGYTKDEFIAKYGKFLPQQTSSNDINKVLQECIMKKRSTYYTNISETKFGEQLWMQSTISPVVNEKGIIEKFVLIETDITEIKKAERKIIFQQHKIQESLNYAERIQASIFPNKNDIAKYFQNYFILLMPREKVSGDFPFFHVYDNQIFIAAADCTGHGVPGAFLSFVGYSNLINIIDSGVFSPSEILYKLNAKFRELMSNNSNAEIRIFDGMEISLCRIDIENQIVTFAGAGHLILFIHDNELKICKGDIKTIGGYVLKNQSDKFTEMEINYNKGDRIYLFSDGLQDQFNNGNSQKKYSSKRLRNFFETNNHFNLTTVHNTLVKVIEEWKGAAHQTDDILVMAFEL